MRKPYHYNLFFDFIDSYLPSGFIKINPEDPIMQRLEEVMEEHDQFFSVFDLGQMKFLFTSKRSVQMLGIKPGELNPGHFTHMIHPEDKNRLGLGRAQIFNIEKEIFQAEKGSMVASYSLRLLNPAGTYNNILGQDYIFFSPIPHKAVFMIQVITNIDWCKMKKNYFHHYVGVDRSIFRYPDEELIKIGHPYTDRELEIIKLVESGLGSKQIAKKLFLSIFTVNTRRSNILEKSGMASISDLIYHLKEQGLL